MDAKTLDQLADEAARALLRATGGPQKAALAGGVTRSTGYRWSSGDRSNPVGRTVEIIRRSTNRWAIVAHLAAEAVRADLADAGPMLGWRLRDLWGRICDDEEVADGEENVQARRYQVGQVDLAALYDADARVLACRLQRMALNLVARLRGIDPRTGEEGRP